MQFQNPIFLLLGIPACLGLVWLYLRLGSRGNNSCNNSRRPNSWNVSRPVCHPGDET
jgi:hypothetical protein